jgi:hypothetical protein
MHFSHRSLLIGALLLVSASLVQAQAPVDPSGHWEGLVQVPDQALTVEVDLARNSDAVLEGTLGIPAQKLKGLPLLTILVDGKSVAFHARRDQTFKGILSGDGQVISGEFTAGGFSIPFSLTRTGDARIEPPARSAAIAKELEGIWNATLTVKGTPLRLVLHLTNHADGTSSGRVVNVDQGGLEVPVTTITQHAAKVTLEFKVVGASYSGALSTDGTELVGAYSQGAASAPLTFRRAAAPEQRK